MNRPILSEREVAIIKLGLAQVTAKVCQEDVQVDTWRVTLPEIYKIQAKLDS